MKKIILMGIPHHDNLGDIAIAYAEKKFIEDNFSEHELMCFPEENLIENVKREKEKIGREDLILLHGGGNIGNQYSNVEEARRYIIQSFPENRIIMFPQTIYFTEDDAGRSEMGISKKIYSSHKDLTIIPREEKSYEIIQKEFSKNKIVFLPDIVMYLNEYKKQKRNGALIIFRNDKEKSVSTKDTENIIKNVSNKYKKVEKNDISYGSYLAENESEQKLLNIWDKYRQVEIVVTDRLHGMIFAAITKTPCIVLGNYNHKVESFYHTWFENVKSVQFIKNANEVDLAIEKIRRCDEIINLDMFKKKFDKLVNIIKED